MPDYTYVCTNCNKKFELFSSINNYEESPKCLNCNSKKTQRSYKDDLSTVSGSVRKSDSELRTIGDLANRNRDKLSNDEKVNLHNKHNSYKDQPIEKLPNGMKQIKKPKKKIKWT
jgi:putative FmdB family regulatory protein